MKKKIIQVPVIVGKGTEQFFVEKEVKISPPNPPIFKIEKIDKKVVITDAHVIPGKVIFNAYIWKNVAYKTVEEVCDGIVSGPIYHATFKIPFGGFVEMKTIGCECVKESDIAELLEAYVEGEKDFLFDEAICKGQKVYNCLLEKDVVKISFKVIRYEHLPICVEEEKKKNTKRNATTNMTTKRMINARRIKKTNMTLAAKKTDMKSVMTVAEITTQNAVEAIARSGSSK